MIAKKKKFHFKVTYPDGDIEYWYDELRSVWSERDRLEKLYKDKIKIEFLKEDEVYGKAKKNRNLP